MLKTAATHDGVFHADDVFAAAALLIAYPGISIVRTRKPELISAADIAFDVGSGPFDHHQRGGNGERNNGVPFASFGLVWRVYGLDVVRARYDAPADQAWSVAAEVDRILVQPIDAADNGVGLYAIHSNDIYEVNDLMGKREGDAGYWVPRIVPAFDGIRPATISSVIHWMSPAGWETSPDFDGAFFRAVEMARTVLIHVIDHAASAVWGRDVISKALTRMEDGIAVMDAYVTGWQDSLIGSGATYVVYPSAGTWRVQGVPARAGSNELVRPLPEEWAGLDGPALAELTGVADATFAHRGRFIAGAQSRDGALALARLAMQH